MANPEITNNDSTKLLVFNPIFKDATINFAGALTYSAGMIMALAQVEAGTVTPILVTGDGTCTGFALAPDGPPMAGDWNLECIVAVTNGGTFKLEDPNGAIVANDLVMTVGAGAATTFVVAGMTFIITDGTADFAVGDKFTLAIDAVNKYVPYAVDGLDGSQIPSAINPAETSSTGAGDAEWRILIGGEVQEELLSILAGGSITEDLRLALRDFTIISVPTRRIDLLDNQ
jgi:hypothetical protein